MAFGNPTTVFNHQNKTAKTSWTISPSANMASGDYAIVIVASDNVSSAGPAQTSDHLQVQSNAGSGTQTFSLVGVYTSAGAAAAGATVSVWYRKLTQAITTSDSITISFNGTVTATGCVGGTGTMDSTKNLGVAAGTPDFNSGSGAPTITVGTTASSTYLFFSGYAVESNTECVTGVGAGLQALTDNTAFTTGGGGAANMSCGAMWDIDTTNSKALNPTTGASGDFAAIGVAFEEQATTTTIAADSGSYSLTGTAATLTAQRKDAAAVGAYALTGTAATLSKGRLIAAVAGAYSYAGTAATLRWDRRIAGAVGAYLLTGTAAGLLRGLKLIGAVGSYALTGTAVQVLRGTALAAAAGAYALTGTAAQFLRGLRSVAAVGSYALAGTAAALKAGRLLAGAAGSYAYTGTAATLTQAGAPGNTTLIAGVGSYVITYAWAWSARDPGASVWSAVSPTSPSWAAVSPSSPSWSTIAPVGPTWTAIPPTSTNWS